MVRSVDLDGDRIVISLSVWWSDCLCEANISAKFFTQDAFAGMFVLQLVTSNPLVRWVCNVVDIINHIFKKKLCTYFVREMQVIHFLWDHMKSFGRYFVMFVIPFQSWLVTITENMYMMFLKKVTKIKNSYYFKNHLAYW